MMLYHFVNDNGHLSRDMSAHRAEKGSTLTVSGTPALFEWGLHASPSPYIALTQAPGHIVCIVTLDGEPMYKPGILVKVGQSRTILWLADARHALQLVALQALVELWGDEASADFRDELADLMTVMSLSHEDMGNSGYDLLSLRDAFRERGEAKGFWMRPEMTIAECTLFYKVKAALSMCEHFGSWAITERVPRLADGFLQYGYYLTATQPPGNAPGVHSITEPIQSRARKLVDEKLITAIAELEN